MSGTVVDPLVNEDNHSFVSGQCSSNSDCSLLSSGWATAITGVGQVFEGGVAEFRLVLCKYASEKGFKFIYVKNNNRKVVSVCSENFAEGCNWSITAVVSSVNGFCSVRKFDDVHTCGLLFGDREAKRINGDLIASLIVDNVKSNPKFSAMDVVNHFLIDYGFDISYKKAWNAINRARSMIYGDSSESFNMLRNYCDAMSSLDPCGRVKLDVDQDSNRFRRLFFAFGASVEGFKYCRPLLFLDGTFLKGRFKGVLLSAIGKDGNQGLYPLCFAVVDAENQDNWFWFLCELREILGSSRQFNFVSDRNPGLLDGLTRVFGDAHHFYCLQHLKQNLRDKFRGTALSHKFREHLIWLFRECAYASSEKDFYDNLEKLKKKGGNIVKRFLEGLSYECWTNVFSGGCRYGEMSSNAVESFNSWILDLRDLSVTHMVDGLRLKLMKWFCVRRENATKWNGTLCPNMLTKVNDLMHEGRTFDVKPSSNFIFEVMSVPSASVNVEGRSCSCKGWQLNGFPCVHAAVVIGTRSLPLTVVVDPYFHVLNYRRSYEKCIVPIPSSVVRDCARSDVVEIFPPSSNRLPGRPKKKRLRSRGEMVRPMKCGRCGKIGNHNRKTCKEPLH